MRKTLHAILALIAGLVLLVLALAVLIGRFRTAVGASTLHGLIFLPSIAPLLPTLYERVASWRLNTGRAGTLHAVAISVILSPIPAAIMVVVSRLLFDGGADDLPLSYFIVRPRLWLDAAPWLAGCSATGAVFLILREHRR